MNFKEIASTMTNAEIIDAIKALNEEQQRRKKAQHQRRIDNYPNEWYPIYVEDWDCFEFD